MLTALCCFKLISRLIAVCLHSGFAADEHAKPAPRAKSVVAPTPPNMTGSLTSLATNVSTLTINDSPDRACYTNLVVRQKNGFIPNGRSTAVYDNEAIDVEDAGFCTKF